MKKTALLFFAILVTIILPGCSLDNQSKNKSSAGFTPEQVKAIKTIINEHFLENPQLLIQASKKLQDQEEKNQVEKIQKNIPKYKNQIFNSKLPGRVVLGNPNGKIIIALFTQHLCSGCKAAAPLIDQLLNENKEIQLIVIYWPFLGDDAKYIAKAAIASYQQNQLKELESKIAIIDRAINKEQIDLIAKSIAGLDHQKFKVTLTSKELEEGLAANFKLGLNLSLIGTPTFIFTNRAMDKFSVVPGKTANFEEDVAKALKAVE